MDDQNWTRRMTDHPFRRAPYEPTLDSGVPVASDDDHRDPRRHRGAIALPYLSPVAKLFGFTPLPPIFLAYLAGIVGLYVFTAEFAKAEFYRRWQ